MTALIVEFKLDFIKKDVLNEKLQYVDLKDNFETFTGFRDSIFAGLCVTRFLNVRFKLKLTQSEIYTIYIIIKSNRKIFLR